MTGHVHSIQSLGTVDGLGIRFVVFTQGCPLRCGCCHNPDTQPMSGGAEYTPEELVNRAVRYKAYFGKQGGITFSGGEPLLQADFARETFELCHKEEINTCLDTSGCALTDEIKLLLCHTDRVLLDIKYTSDELYKRYVGCTMSAPTDFLDYLNRTGIPTTLRQVIIPTINDNKENILALKKIANMHSCVDKVELLPFRKICQMKYDNMGIKFPFAHIPEPSREKIRELESYLE